MVIKRLVRGKVYGLGVVPRGLVMARARVFGSHTFFFSSFGFNWGPYATIRVVTGYVGGLAVTILGSVALAGNWQDFKIG